MSTEPFDSSGPMGPSVKAIGTIEGPAKKPTLKRSSKTKGRRASGTGSIYLESNGSYRVKFSTGVVDLTTGRTKYVKRRAKSHEEAVKILNALTTSQGIGTLRPPAQQTLACYLLQWVGVVIRPTRSPRTTQGYEDTIRLFIVPSLTGRKKIQDVKPNDIQNLLNEVSQKPIPRLKGTPREGETYSRRQVEIVKAVLRAGINHALKVDRIISFNPADGASVPRNARKTKRKQSMELADVSKFVKVLRTNEIYGPVILFMLATGTRVGEAIGLRWRDIDFQSETVRIQGQLQRVKGKGMVYSAETKTGQARTISLPASIVLMLKDMFGANTIGERDQDPEGIVFLNSAGGRMDSQGISRRMKLISKHAGVSPPSPHILRHTAATLMLESSGDLHGTAKVLGHSQVAQTADLYGHILEKRNKAFSNILENSLFGNESGDGSSKRH